MEETPASLKGKLLTMYEDKTRKGPEEEESNVPAVTIILTPLVAPTTPKTASGMPSMPATP